MEIKLLGYIVSGEGRKIAPDRIADILEIREPMNVKELQQFLGLIPFNMEFLEGIYRTVQPLQRLQQEGVEWE